MDPITISALTMAAASGANAAATGTQNKKSRAFSREMYQQTKADNLNFWNMQNEYNSPEQQMQRLKNAGLNPNMLYDKTGAVIPAQNINTPDVQSAQFRTPDFGSIGTNLVQGYFDTKIKQAQYDNLKTQNTVSQQEAILKAAQAAGEVKRTEGQGISNLVASSNVDAMIRRAGLENDKIEANLKYTLDENTRKEIMQGKSLQLIAQDILLRKEQVANTSAERENIQQTLKNLKEDQNLKKLEAGLLGLGINKNDPIYVRIAGTALNGILDQAGTPEFQSGIDKYIPFPYNNAVRHAIGKLGNWRRP